MLFGNLQTSLDEPTQTLVMHRTEPSRIQGLSLQLADKINILVEQNERLWELKNNQGGGFGQGRGDRFDRRDNRNRDNREQGGEGNENQNYHGHHRGSRNWQNDRLEYKGGRRENKRFSRDGGHHGDREGGGYQRQHNRHHNYRNQDHNKDNN